MRNKYFFVLLSVIAILAVAVFPVGAVTDGEPDGDGHPFVGLMVAQLADGTPLWRCSGTLLSPTLFLTAGHCTEAPAAHVEIWFDADVESGIPANGYPFTGDVGGTPYTHPDYNPNAFFVRDVGVVVLDEPYYSPNGEYGELPLLNQLDALKTKRGLQNVTFTAVGYGLQMSFPDAASWKENNVRVRMVAHPKLNQINVPGFTGDFSLLLSNNAHTGGTCFGDSGGPNFLGSGNSESKVIAGVTSFGINGNCAGTGGVFRLDRQNVLDFLSPFLP
ncbi:MAG: trypsin-like serine protease [Anaerolineales bacterium]|nr:trypsin-like serine protease [Anaerolineales bacterium]